MASVVQRPARPGLLLPVLLVLVGGQCAHVTHAEGGGGGFVTVERGPDGVWWFQHRGQRFFSTGVSNVNNGGADDGAGGVLARPCRAQENSSLCGDTNNWSMGLGYAPYHNVTMALFNGSEPLWADDTVARLGAWGFNSVGGYSSHVAEAAVGRAEMYYNHLLMFATRFAMPAGTPLQQTTAGGCFAYDVFSARFEAAADAYARENVAPRANDPWLLGWHFEKEVSWQKMDLRFWFSPKLAGELVAGRANATAFLRARYNHSVDKLNAAWHCNLAADFDPDEIARCLDPVGYEADCGDGWAIGPPGVRMAAVTSDSEAFLVQSFAKRYFDVVTAAIRRYDGNHLLLGMRGGCFGSTALLSLFANYIDVYDLHHYGDVVDGGELLQMYEQVHNETGLPILHGEFSYTALDSNVPNFRGARSCGQQHPDAGQTNCRPGQPFVLQRDRASAAEAQSRKIASVPYLVGYHWWRWVDEAAGGRWPRAENSNYGLVRLDNTRYLDLTDALTRANEAAADLHRQSAGSSHDGTARLLIGPA